MSTPTLTHCWPQDSERALLIGRIWQPGSGPVLVAATPQGLHDLSALAPTCSALLGGRRATCRRARPRA